MDNLIYILFICTISPLLLMLLLLPNRSRIIVTYMIVGIFVSLFVSEFNTIVLNYFNGNTIYVTTTITPINEEIVKAIPILFYALVFSDDRRRIMPIAFALGIGFAMFENMVILTQNIQTVTIGWAIIRGLSTALMHGVCAAMAGFGICFVRKKKKLFYTGTFALILTASIYHGIFNMLVQSDYKLLGFFLPAFTYIPIFLKQYQYYKNQKNKKSEAPKSM